MQPRAGADVRHAPAANARQHELDQPLGFGARNQRAAVGAERQVAEPGPSGDIGQRLAGGAPAGWPRRTRWWPLARRAQTVRRSPCPTGDLAGDLGPDPERLAARHRHARGLERARRPSAISVPPRHRAQTASCSCRLAMRSASISSSRSPSMTSAQVVHGQVDPVVGHPALGEVVGADLGRAVAGAHHGAAVPRRAPPPAPRSCDRAAAPAALPSP